MDCREEEESKHPKLRVCALAAPNFIYSPAGSNRSVLLLQCDRWRQMCLCVCGGASAAVRLLLPPPTPLKDNKKIFSFVYWTERPPTGPAQREVGERKKGRRPTWWRAPRPSHQYNKKKKKVKKNWREEEENAHSSGPEENRSFFSKRIQRNPSVLDSPFPFFSLWNGPKSRNVVRETWDAWVSVCIIQSFFPVGSKRDTESSSLEEISWRNKPVAFFFVLAAKNAVSVTRGSKYLHRFDYTETFGGKFKFLLTGSHYTARPLSLTVSTLFLFLRTQQVR